jgi:hypothetical protein
MDNIAMMGGGYIMWVITMIGEPLVSTVLHWVNLCACVILALGGLGCAANANSPKLTQPISVENGTSTWRLYSDLEHGFFIRYPAPTQPQLLSDQEMGLKSRVSFNFEQPFNNGEDTGTLKFRFLVSVWQNTNSLTAEAWAKQNTNPQLRSAVRQTQVAGRTGATVRTSNLAWDTVETFVADKDLMYELSYTDITSNALLSNDKRSHWVDVFNRMLGSFSFSSEHGK